MYEKGNNNKNIVGHCFDFNRTQPFFHNDITLIIAAILMAVCIVISFAKKQ